MVASVDKVLADAESLPPADRMLLIQRLTESLMRIEKTGKSRQMRFGVYSSGQQSTEEDFKIAEWHPTEAELNGE
jgi:hypothetical protein